MSEKREASLYDLYSGLFDCTVADSDFLVDECYRLRYQVYCIENPYKEPDAMEGEYERDAFDGHSIHALLRYSKTGEYIGTVRTIMGGADSPRQMPVFQVAEENHIFMPEKLYREPVAEISRFCISKDFRRRITDTMYATSYTPDELAQVRSRVIPFMAIGLISMAFRICRAHEIHQCCAVMETSLIRLLAKLGIYFKPIGAPIDYYGQRQIAYITASEMLESLKNERPDVLELITDRGRFSFDY